jgi:hypothetical protein
MERRLSFIWSGNVCRNPVVPAAHHSQSARSPFERPPFSSTAGCRMHPGAPSAGRCCRKHPPLGYAIPRSTLARRVTAKARSGQWLATIYPLLQPPAESPHSTAHAGLSSVLIRDRVRAGYHDTGADIEGLAARRAFSPLYRWRARLVNTARARGGLVTTHRREA